jgi:hypothetical protein
MGAMRRRMSGTLHPARRLLLALALLSLALAGLSFIGAQGLTGWLDRLLGLHELAREMRLTHPAVLLALALYACLIAIPFVPGAELGLLLVALFGAPIAGPVYLATVAALILAFATGRALRHPRLQRWRGRVGLDAALEALQDRMASDQSGRWRRLHRHRFLCLIVLINTPGNTLLGGGGGISMAAGFGGAFRLREFLASVLIAVAPVPLAVIALGWTP